MCYIVIRIIWIWNVLYPITEGQADYMISVSFPVACWTVRFSKLIHLWYLCCIDWPRKCQLELWWPMYLFPYTFTICCGVDVLYVYVLFDIKQILVYEVQLCLPFELCAAMLIWRQLNTWIRGRRPSQVPVEAAFSLDFPGWKFQPPVDCSVICFVQQLEKNFLLPWRRLFMCLCLWADDFW